MNKIKSFDADTLYQAWDAAASEVKMKTGDGEPRGSLGLVRKDDEAVFTLKSFIGENTAPGMFLMQSSLQRALSDRFGCEVEVVSDGYRSNPPQSADSSAEERAINTFKVRISEKKQAL